MPNRTVMDAVPQAVWSKFKPAADARGILASRMMLQLLRKIAEDDLVEAVMDDAPDPDIASARVKDTPLQDTRRTIGRVSEVALPTPSIAPAQSPAAPRRTSKPSPAPAPPSPPPKPVAARPAVRRKYADPRTVELVSEVPQLDIPLHMRKANLDAAIVHLKRHCILVDTVNRDELVRRYRVSGLPHSVLAVHIIQLAVQYGFEVISG